MLIVNIRLYDIFFNGFEISFNSEYQPDFWGAAPNSYFDLGFGVGVPAAGSAVSPSSISSGNSSSSLSYNVSPYNNMATQSTRGSKSTSALINGESIPLLL